MRLGWITAGAPRRRVTLAVLALAIAAEAVAAQAVLSWCDARHYPGVDLRARVVGVRMALAGQDPYFGRQDQAVADELWDPLRPATMSRCTYSPAVLLFYAPLAKLPYRPQRFLWALLEWTALGLSIACLGGTLPRRTRRTTWLVAAAVLFVGTYFWRVHVERGQYYVFLLVAWSAAWCLVQRRRGRGGELLAGGALGVAIACRPTAVVMLAPLALLRERRVVAVGLVSAAAWIMLSALLFGATSWSQFFRAGAAWERAVLEIEPLDAPFVWRPVADGYRLTRALPSHMDNTALVAVAGSIWPGRPSAALGARLVCGLLLVAVTVATAFRNGVGRASAARRRQAFLVAFVLAILADLALPIRYGYADVLWLAPLALALPLWSRGVGLPSAALVGLGLLLGRGSFELSVVPSILPLGLVSAGFLSHILTVVPRRRRAA
jgi:hypothetical protein